MYIRSTICAFALLGLRKAFGKHILPVKFHLTLNKSESCMTMSVKIILGFVALVAFVAAEEEDPHIHVSTVWYDHSKTYMVMKREAKDGIDECYILTPNFEQDTASLDLTGSTEESEYYIQKNKLADVTILSPRTRELCQGLDVFWITLEPKGIVPNVRERREETFSL